MATTQYLFRLHHDPIIPTTAAWTAMLEAVPALTNKQTELHHSDFVVSLPETSTDLIQQADMFAYAQAIITTFTSIWAIAVFQLSDETDADNTTPVIVLHPYRDANLAPEDISHNPDERYFPTFNYFDLEWPEETFSAGRVGDGFESYLLHAGQWHNGVEFLYVDAWMVAVIARSVERGRHQLQFVKRAIDWTDFFFAVDGSLVLHDQGTLSRTRFPLWKTAIESLPHGHAGYTVDSAGRLKQQPRALRNRVLNGVSNMAQQRRMFVRRNYAISVVMRSWYATCKKLMAWHWWNDRHGWATAMYFPWGTGQSGEYGQLAATDVPWEYLKNNLQFVVDFLNLVNVAQGDLGLIISLPGKAPEALEQEYQNILSRLRGADGLVHRFVVRNVATHHEILRHMVDVLAHIIGEIMDYRAAFQAWVESSLANTSSEDLQRAHAGVQIVNEFAVKWPVLLNEFYSLMCLMFTWQLTWDVSEPSRGAATDEPIRNKVFEYVPQWQRGFYIPAKDFPSKNLDLFNDFGSRRPSFAPYRTWDIQLFDTGFDQQASELQAQQRAQAAQDFFNMLAAQKAARENAARAARQQYLENWEAERQARDDPNPDDVWDYRNFRSLDWWKQKAQEPLNVEFALRAVDIPNELLSPYALGVGLARNHIPMFSRYSDANGWNETNQPGGAPLERIPYSQLVVLTKRLVGGVPTTVAVQIVGDVAGALADHLGENDERYSPRQFWPSIPSGTGS